MKNLYSIPESKILERLRFENPWWLGGGIDAELAALPRRLYFNLFMQRLSEVELKRAIILMGPRRVGKTVMMHHAIAQLLDQGVAPAKILFIGIDNPIYINMGLEELFLLGRSASGDLDTEGRYVFFDEIQYLKDWERHLKVLVDSYPKTKFIVSGSATAALKARSSESGAGRFHDFLLPPLTFQEFIHLQNLNTLIKPSSTYYEAQGLDLFETLDIKALNEQFIQYLNYGGYPEVIFSDRIKNNMPRYVKNDIIDKVLLRDLPSIYGIKDVQELNRFFAYVAYNTGKEFSFEKISQESGLDKGLIRRYMEYLEAAFLVTVVHKVDERAKSFKRVTGFKVYLSNPSLRTALFSPIQSTDDETGSLVETAIFSQCLHYENSALFYSRWKTGRSEGEVDMVKLNLKNLLPSWCSEVKWSNRYFERPNELKSLLEFCKKNGLRNALVSSIDKTGESPVNDLKLYFYPAALYAYSLGASTMKR